MGEKEPKFPSNEHQAAQQQLDAYGISYTDWGQGESKSLRDLELEIATGDASLGVEDGELLRQVDVLAADIVYQDASGQWWRLREDRQMFTDGRVRHRHLDSTLGEKIKQQEDRDLAMIRAIQEELNRSVGADALNFQETKIVTRESPSFPGLQTQYRKHYYRIRFADEQITLDPNGSPLGYQEQQEDKTTYFEWEPIPDPNRSTS